MRQLDGAKSDAAVQRLKIRADLSPFDFAESRKYAIKPLERDSGFISCVNHQRLLLLPQEQETHRMIHIGIGQKNACNGSVARRIVARVQRRHVFDLLAQVRRRVD